MRTNKRTKTKVIDDKEVRIVFDLESQRVKLSNLRIRTSAPRQLRLKGYEETRDDSNFIVSKLWAQLFSNLDEKLWLLAHAKRRKYMKLTSNERACLKEGFFWIIDLKRNFHCFVESDNWNKTFEHMFFEWGYTRSSTLQNYTQMTYWVDYIAIRDHMKTRDAKEEFEIFRNTLMKRWNAKLTHMSYARCDRLISTDLNKRSRQSNSLVYSKGYLNSCSLIVTNLAFKGAIMCDTIDEKEDEMMVDMFDND